MIFDVISEMRPYNDDRLQELLQPAPGAPQVRPT
jgi:hypothetical protein